MKKLFASIVLFGGLFVASNASAQVTCDSIKDICQDYLSASAGKLFISDGQVYRAFLQDEETAEFETTFFGGSTYRLAVAAGKRKDYVIFEIRDRKDNLLFTNADHKNAHYWDFSVSSTMECKIETRLDSNKKSNGCAVMLIGFQN